MKENLKKIKIVLIGSLIISFACIVGAVVGAIFIVNKEIPKVMIVLVACLGIYLFWKWKRKKDEVR